MSHEVLLTSCNAPQTVSVTVYDPKTGNSLLTYKNGGVAAPKCLNLISDDYLLTADAEKPMTHVWGLSNQESDRKLSTILPEKPQVLKVCPHNTYLAAGIKDKLYVWELSSGVLFNVERTHFQNITCIEFSQNGEFIIVGGEDGMVVAYLLNEFISIHKANEISPLFSRNDHTLPVTDLYVGPFKNPRLATVSSDNTCKFYQLPAGDLLLNLVFDESVTSVIFDNPSYNLYTGMESGRIQQFHLRNPPRQLIHHVTDGLIFKGHHKRVTCLTLSFNNQLLASGSDDKFVLIWELSSRQVLRKLEHRGEITNIRFVLKYNNFFTQKLHTKHILKLLQRDLSNRLEFQVNVLQNHGEKSRKDGGFNNQALIDENIQLKAANYQLYQAGLEILKGRHG